MSDRVSLDNLRIWTRGGSRRRHPSQIRCLVARGPVTYDMAGSVAQNIAALELVFDADGVIVGESGGARQITRTSDMKLLLHRERRRLSPTPPWVESRPQHQSKSFIRDWPFPKRGHLDRLASNPRPRGLAILGTGSWNGCYCSAIHRVPAPSPPASCRTDVQCPLF
jgi:hypothetical protein